MEDIVSRSEDGYVRLTDLLGTLGQRDITNFQRTSCFRNAVKGSQSSTGMSEADLVKIKRGRNGGTFVHPDLSQRIIDTFNANRKSTRVGVTTTEFVPPVSTDRLERLERVRDAWVMEQHGELKFNLKRKQLLDELGLSDDSTNDFFRDLIINGKRRFIEGPPPSLLAAATADDSGVRLIASDDVAQEDSAVTDEKSPVIVIPSGQVLVTSPPPPSLVTYESLGVTDVLFRFAGFQLTSAQSAEVGRRVRRAFEAKHHRGPLKNQMRVNGHLVDACVYRREDWHLIHEAFADYNDDLERSGRPRIKQTHQIIARE